ncbi:hypothetical protein [Streptomyces sp. NPDC016626]|uniref:hypothetical protein n=1 Tax=Streptomyces sp. NPDC016626 TaxID=3364968 RepID=UPI0036F7FD83
MTREERQAYIRRLVDAAPALSPADADMLRHLMPLQSLRPTGPASARQQLPTHRQAA